MFFSFFFGFSTALKFITYWIQPFAVRAAFCCDPSLCRFCLQPSIFPRLLRWRLQLPNFCSHISLQIFGAIFSANIFATIFLCKYLLHFSKKMTDNSSVSRLLLFPTRNCESAMLCKTFVFFQMLSNYHQKIKNSKLP